MANDKPLVISGTEAHYGKTLLGGFQVSYPCPRCKSPLVTKNDSILAGDYCPNCRCSFSFDDEIRNAFAAFVAERRHKEINRINKQAEQEELRRAMEEERFRSAAEQFAANEAKRQRENEEEQARLKNRQKAEEKAGRDVRGPYGCVVALLVLGWVGSALLGFAAFAMLNNPYFQNKDLAQTLLILSISSAVSLVLVYALFRFLLAIHSLLAAILERLSPPAE